MDTPTKVLTVGIGALAAVAAYLGWQNVQETPEIIDSDVHDYDSKVNNSKVSGVFSKKIVDSDDEKTKEEESNEEEEKQATNEEESNEEEEKQTTKEEEAEEKELAKKEVKKHIDKHQSAWGQFWKSEYNDIQNKEETE